MSVLGPLQEVVTFGSPHCAVCDLIPTNVQRTPEASFHQLCWSYRQLGFVNSTLLHKIVFAAQFEQMQELIGQTFLPTAAMYDPRCFLSKVCYNNKGYVSKSKKA